MAAGAGGLSLWANAGAIRFYSGGNAEKARIHASGGMSIGNTTDPGNTSLSVTGNISVGSNISAYSISASYITLGSGNIQAAYLFATSYVVVGGTTLSNALPALRSDGSGILGVIRADGSSYTNINANSYYSQGAGNNFADLTVRGATNFASLSTTGGITATGNIVIQGYLFPGRVDATATQGGWYLASHASYGLYSNTGLYLTQALWTTNVAARSTGNSFADLTVTGATNFIGGVATSGGNITTTGYIMSTSWMFPGRTGDAGGAQTNWGLGSHASYGLYTNNGFFITGNCWAAGYPGASDIRLKNDLGLATETSALRKVIVHDFIWKADGRRDCGVFAQELDQYIPSVVYKGKTAEEPWGVDYSKLVAHVIVGWQEHDRELAALKAEIADLRNTLKGRA